MEKQYETGTRKLIFLSDDHCGDKTAVCPPNVSEIIGSTYGYTEFQEKLWNFRLDFYEKAAKWLNGEKFTFIHGGEPIQGVFPRFGTLMGGRKQQFDVFREVMLKFKEFVNDEQWTKSFFLSGNEIHCGLEGEIEEMILDNLKDDLKIIQKDKRYARRMLHLELPNGAILQGIHFFNYTNIYDLTAYQREVQQTARRYAEIDKKPPTVLYRAHVHHCNILPYQCHPLSEVSCFTTAGWMGANEYVLKRLARNKITNFGGCFMDVNDKVTVKSHLLTITPFEEHGIEKA